MLNGTGASSNARPSVAPAGPQNQPSGEQSAALWGGIDMGSGNRLFDPNSGRNALTSWYWQRRDFAKAIAALETHRMNARRVFALLAFALVLIGLDIGQAAAQAINQDLYYKLS